MTSTPTLVMLDFEEPFIIELDASDKWIGVVLSQRGHPVTYVSHLIGPTKEGWSTYQKEMPAIVMANLPHLYR
ncbi:unnamed protein product [Linum trigynum]|uniref:Reverse transcriptase/retrotransposon-derived protein RNase H-like domain-containing protein n=1 Tax=Linum trigynum TaxID=586398 RepID=A0AAV2FCX7_9ROSI